MAAPETGTRSGQDVSCDRRPLDGERGDRQRGLPVNDSRRWSAVAMANGVRCEQTSASLKLRRDFNADLVAALEHALEVMRERQALLPRRKDSLDGLLDGLLRVKSDDRFCDASEDR